MQSLPKDKILEHPSDIITSIRRQYDLDKPGRMADAVRILREWIQKQPHFKKKDISDHYLEITIVDCKGSMERAKKQLDRMCTLRTLLPQFYGPFNPKTDFALTMEAFNIALLPKLTPDGYRVFMININDNILKLPSYMDYFRYLIMLCEYIKSHDYYCGVHIIVDFTKAKFTNFFYTVNFVHMRQILTILIEGYGLRLRGLHLFSDSKLLDTYVNIVKPFVSPKIGARFHSRKSLDDLSAIIPLDILPKEFGGKERSIVEMSNEWIEVLSSEEFNEYLKEMSEAGTDESCRPVDKFNQEYAGMSGTFKHLSVD